MRLLFATQNQHKLAELRELAADTGLVVVGTAEVGLTEELPETGTSFEANALQKATEASRLSGLPALADDSGLEVDALGGAPGIHSARYSGVSGPGQDAANRRKLLQAMTDVPHGERGARFRCVLAFVVPGRAPLTFQGACEGGILHEERGTGGFGYDPLFYVAALGKTMAELDPATKNGLSHRGHAMRAFVASRCWE